jgi:hypothetical protein
VFFSLLSVLCSLFSVLYPPFSVLPSPRSILRSPFSLLRAPISILYHPFSNCRSIKTLSSRHTLPSCFSSSHCSSGRPNPSGLPYTLPFLSVRSAAHSAVLIRPVRRTPCRSYPSGPPHTLPFLSVRSAAHPAVLIRPVRRTPCGKQNSQDHDIRRKTLFHSLTPSFGYNNLYRRLETNIIQCQNYSIWYSII